MRRVATLGVLLGTLTMLAGLGPGTAVAGTTKLVEGTVYDTTCAVVGECGSPCPPPCGGPIPLPGPRNDIVCTQARRLIVCPLADTGVAPDFCLQGLPCGTSYPVYPNEGAVVTVRRHGSKSPAAELPVVEGRFRVRLPPGTYNFRPYLPDPHCWSGARASVEVTPKLRSPLFVAVSVRDNCAAEAAGAH